MTAVYTRTRIRQTRTRHELGLAAQELREALHFSRLPRSIDLSGAAELARSIGEKLDDFMRALGNECGAEAFEFKAEPFYDAAHAIATRFDERRQDLRIVEDSDEDTDRGCWKYHQARE